MLNPRKPLLPGRGIAKCVLTVFVALSLVVAGCSSLSETECLNSPKYTLIAADKNRGYDCEVARNACENGFVQNQHGALHCEGKCFCPEGLQCICGGGPPSRCKLNPQLEAAGPDPGNASGPSALPDPLIAGWEGASVCERLHEDSEQRILRCTFPPAVGHERHFHAPNFGYALAGGRMRITDESGVREIDLPTGSSFNSDGVAWHEVLNVGDSTVVYLIVERK